MHPILRKLLDKRKITPDKLDVEEKKDFDRWEGILSGGEVTIDKLKEFCKAQKNTIEAKWKNFDNTDQRLVIAHTIYSTIIKAIEAPESEREALEAYLKDLIEK